MFHLQPDLSFLKSYSDRSCVMSTAGGGERAPLNDLLSEYSVWGTAFRLSSSAGAPGCDDAISSHCHRTSLTSLVLASNGAYGYSILRVAYRCLTLEPVRNYKTNNVPRCHFGHSNRNSRLFSQVPWAGRTLIQSSQVGCISESMAFAVLSSWRIIP